MKTPLPKRKNVILKLPNNDIKLSNEEMSSEVEAEIAFIGSLVDYYTVGEKVLFNKNKATEIKYFSDIYWSIHEDYITCGISYDSI